MADKIRCTRTIVIEGDREWVEATLVKSIRPGAGLVLAYGFILEVERKIEPVSVELEPYRDRYILDERVGPERG